MKTGKFELLCNYLLGGDVSTRPSYCGFDMLHNSLSEEMQRFLLPQVKAVTEKSCYIMSDRKYMDQTETETVLACRL
jgi:hypothetical protein